MPNITSSESYAKAQVVKNVWQWTLENFHKLSEANKIKISIAIMGRDMATKIEGKIEGGETKIIIIRSEEKIGDKTFTISRAKESEMNGN